MKRMRGFLKSITRPASIILDNFYRSIDLGRVQRTRNLRLIPGTAHRHGGKNAYAEWAHVIGVFQTILYLQTSSNTEKAIEILDVGCGTGILAIASAPFLQTGGHYLGIDVSREDIGFCKQHYPSDQFKFQHLDVQNRSYAPQQPQEKRRWDVPDNSRDVVTALSVWTHLNEDDAIFYFGEINRVLKPGGKAIITMFLLDESYYQSLNSRSTSMSSYHNTRQNKWIFDQPCSHSGEWFYPSWAVFPEDAIGITSQGVVRVTHQTNLRHICTYPGNWKEQIGVYFQDVLIFEKSNTPND